MKLRTVTYAQSRDLGVAVSRARELRDLLKSGGASPRLLAAVRSIIKRVEGAHNHALRCRLNQQRRYREG